MNTVSDFLEKPGFDAGERLVIVHVDDIGMCQSTLSAFAELWDRGAVSSGSVMTPCPWFPAVAEWYNRHLEADLGVHITLTSEWSAYRWGPVTVSVPADNLMDSSQRYFHATRAAVCRRADTGAVSREMRGQLALARRFGLRPSHIDSHMLTCLQPRFLPDFLRLALANRLPALVTRAYLRQLDDAAEDLWERHLGEVGLPVFEQFVVVNRCLTTQAYNAALKTIVGSLPVGLSCILLHPAKDSPELRATVDNWKHRVVEYEALLQKKLWCYAREAGVKIVNYQQLFQPRSGVEGASVSGLKR